MSQTSQTSRVSQISQTSQVEEDPPPAYSESPYFLPAYVLKVRKTANKTKVDSYLIYTANKKCFDLIFGQIVPMTKFSFARSVFLYLEITSF